LYIDYHKVTHTHAGTSHKNGADLLPITRTLNYFVLQGIAVETEDYHTEDIRLHFGASHQLLFLDEAVNATQQQNSRKLKAACRDSSEVHSKPNLLVAGSTSRPTVFLGHIC